MVTLLMTHTLFPSHSSRVQDKLVHFSQCKCAYELCTNSDLLTNLLLYYFSTVLSNVISFYSLKELDKQKIKQQLSFTVLLHDKMEKVEESRVEWNLKRREGWGKMVLAFVLNSHYPNLLSGNKSISLSRVCFASDSNCSVNFLSLFQPTNVSFCFLTILMKMGSDRVAW